MVVGFILLDLTPKCLGTKSVLIVQKSNLKCCNFCIQCLNSIEVVGKSTISLLVHVVKFSNQSKMH